MSNFLSFKMINSKPETINFIRENNAKIIMKEAPHSQQKKQEREKRTKEMFIRFANFDLMYRKLTANNNVALCCLAKMKVGSIW